MGRISTGAKAGAALVACLAVPAAVVLVTAVADLRDGDEHTTAGVLDRLGATAAVSERLQAESIWYGVELTGTAEAIELPPGADAGSPERTDQAIDALRTVVDGQDAGASEAYAPAFDALGTLSDIRADIEASRATPEFGALGSADLAFDVRSRYAEVSRAVRAAQAGAIDDPDLRANVELGVAVAEQKSLLAEIVSSLLTEDASGPSTSDEVDVVATLLAQWQEGDATLRATEAPYGAMVDEHLPADVAAEVTTVVEQALLTGTLDLPVLIDTVNGGDDGLIQLEAAVVERRSELARAAVDAEHAHRRRTVLMAAAAGLAALASVAVAVVILAVAGSRRPGTTAPPGYVGPPPWPLP